MGMTLGVLMGGIVAGAGPAEAATPASLCGAGYYEIDHHDLNYGTIHLLYNGSTDCVVTWKTSYVGQATQTMAYVMQVNVPPNHVENDNYQYYAGPVWAYAPGKCILWGGAVLSQPKPATINPGDSWGSGPSHCH